MATLKVDALREGKEGKIPLLPQNGGDCSKGPTSPKKKWKEIKRKVTCRKVSLETAPTRREKQAASWKKKRKKRT